MLLDFWVVEQLLFSIIGSNQTVIIHIQMMNVLIVWHAKLVSSLETRLFLFNPYWNSFRYHTEASKEMVCK